jgi:hypothetical protein
MLPNRRVEFRVWYKSVFGGSLLEVATTDEALEKIRKRLSERGIKYKVQRYYLIN